MKQIWRKNFDIKRVDFNLPVETAPGFGGLNYLTNGKNSMSKFIWVTKDLNCDGTYFLKNELREIIELTQKTIFTNPSRCDKVHRQATSLNRKYFKLAEQIRKLPLANLSNRQLLSWRKKLFDLQFISHTWSLPTTWFVDSDGEDFSKSLLDFLQKRIQKLSLDIEVPTAFSILSTPKGTTYSTKEEVEGLKILSWIQSNAKLKHWFMSQTTEELVKKFPKLPSFQKQKIQRHFYNFCWLPYTYIGPAYTLDYFLETWRGLLHEDFDPIKKMAELKEKSKTIQQQKTKIIRLLKLSSLERHWFKVAADIIWLKGFRKDVFFHGFFVLDLLLREIGNRSGLSLLQAKHLLPSELPKALSGKNLSQLANDRQKFSVIYAQTPKNYQRLQKYWTEKGIQVFTGKKAHLFLKKQNFEKIKIVRTNELTGTCACPGKATGTIKIINVPEEMGKMNTGDIMLSHTTFPSLVPAMKKAAAIVTEDGGITCHAAIVARELQTPCIVGCKHALHNFKDRDMVEVDANIGIIKKLSNA